MADRMPWLKLWGEFAFDPKVQALPETLQRRFIMFLCFKCLGYTPKMTLEECAFAMRVELKDLSKTVEALANRGMIDPATLEPTNWEKWQPAQPNSTERVRRHREKKRAKRSNETDETLRNVTGETPGNGETPSEAEPDTDAEPDDKKAIIDRVFAHWLKVMNKPVNRTKLTAKRRSKITARLREGYDEPRLIKAIDGCRLTPHNMGVNDDKKPWNDIELILRNGENVERFEDNVTYPPVWPRSAPIQPPAITDYEDDHGNLGDDE